MTWEGVLTEQIIISTCLNTFTQQHWKLPYRVASNLLPDDYREVTEGHGHDPLNALVVGFQNCDSVYFEVPNGELAGMAGVHKDGQIWMLCTPAIYDYPHTFAREANGM